jgi:SAM-dependent methyltransferase
MGKGLRRSGTEWTAFIQRWLAPELRYSQDYYEDILRRHVAAARSWLDLGCGHHILPPWRIEAERDLVSTVPFLVGIDYDLPSLIKCETVPHRVRGDIAALPFRDQSFDLVTANMVVEHLSQPSHQFAEIARLLRPGGKFLFHTPNLRGYPAMISQYLPDRVKKWLALVLERRREEDVFRTFYKANTRSSIEAAASAAGLRTELFQFTCSVPVFARVPPIAFFELIYIRLLLRLRMMLPYRPTIICVLSKPADRESSAAL